MRRRCLQASMAPHARSAHITRRSEVGPVSQPVLGAGGPGQVVERADRLRDERGRARDRLVLLEAPAHAAMGARASVGCGSRHERRGRHPVDRGAHGAQRTPGHQSALGGVVAHDGRNPGVVGSLLGLHERLGALHARGPGGRRSPRCLPHGVGEPQARLGWSRGGCRAGAGDDRRLQGVPRPCAVGRPHRDRHVGDGVPQDSRADRERGAPAAQLRIFCRRLVEDRSRRAARGRDAPRPSRCGASSAPESAISASISSVRAAASR